MKRHPSPPLRLLFLLAAVTGFLPLRLAAEDDTRRTLAPYFVVLSENARGDAMPLTSTSVDAVVSGVIADVRVIQVYANTGNEPLEAIYIFPASTRAAVHGMEMTIGDRIVKAVIKERQSARKTYEDAKKDGKSASLLEQQRPNVFQMSVANIMPGDEIRVTLSYTELLVPTDRVYEFAFPTVVGPRYSNQPVATASPSEHWIANPYLKQNVRSPITFDLGVQVNAGMPLKEVSCSTHPAKIEYLDDSSATVTLDQVDKPTNDRDFILKYRLAGDCVDSGLLLHQGERENFFLLMVQPPKRVTPEVIPPREYVFVIDVSGSMNGFPLDTAKALVKQLIGRLRETDQFNVILFAGAAQQMAPTSLPATQANIRQAISLIDRQDGGGGTELLQGLQRALDLPGAEGVSRSILVITDGYVSFETEAFDLVRNNLNRANLFAFGIGSSVNRFLVEGLAHVGQGEPFVVTEPGAAPAAAAKLVEYVKSPVLTDVHVDLDGFEARELEPTGLPDVLADRPLILFGKWTGKPVGGLILRGRSGSGEFRQTIEAAESAKQLDNPALARLWARKRIETLSDYNRLDETGERTMEITNLGLTYSLLTAHTSFVAVDEVVRNPGGASTSVKQPLPLPQGVSNLAVGGGSAPITPEPQTWAVLLVIAGVIAWTIHRRRTTCTAN